MSVKEINEGMGVTVIRRHSLRLSCDKKFRKFYNLNKKNLIVTLLRNIIERNKVKYIN